ncbi:hypothetical protein [Halorubrum sp. DTA98]|uniref:hypothetical protein n=1 Tax=Halorubrum sp. DTA98 TaxID=3402163 RepID=UPI003AAFED8A
MAETADQKRVFDASELSELTATVTTGDVLSLYGRTIGAVYRVAEVHVNAQRIVFRNDIEEEEYCLVADQEGGATLYVGPNEYDGEAAASIGRILVEQ